MEILFENSYTRDKEWVQDATRWAFFRRPVLIVSDLILLLYFIMGIYEMAVNRVVYVYWFLIPLALIGVTLFRYKRTVTLSLKRDIEMHGKEIDVTSVVTDEHICYKHSSGTEYTLHYSDIKKVVQAKKYIYLISKSKTVYSFKKEGFSVGTAQQFICFIKSKGIR